MIIAHLTIRTDKDSLLNHYRTVRDIVLPGAVDELARTSRRIMLKNVPVDTGRLRNSLAIAITGQHTRSIFANTPYALIVEFGFTGVQIVSAHTRLQTHAFGFPIIPRRVNVRAHTRFVDRKPKPYVRPGLAHATERILPILRTHLKPFVT